MLARPTCVPGNCGALPPEWYGDDAVIVVGGTPNSILITAFAEGSMNPSVHRYRNPPTSSPPFPGSPKSFRAIHGVTMWMLNNRSRCHSSDVSVPDESGNSWLSGCKRICLRPPGPSGLLGRRQQLSQLHTFSRTKGTVGTKSCQTIPSGRQTNQGSSSDKGANPSKCISRWRPYRVLDVLHSLTFLQQPIRLSMADHLAALFRPRLSNVRSVYVLVV